MPALEYRKAIFSNSFDLPVAASAQDAQAPRMIELGYEITFAGFAGFRMDVAARMDGQAYDVESHTFKEGVLRARTINYVGRNRPWGIPGPSGEQPRGGARARCASRRRTAVARRRGRAPRSIPAGIHPAP